MYLGLIPEQKVVRIHIGDLQKRFELIGKGYVYSTKEAYQNQHKGNVFHPTTHAGITIYSNVVYSARMIKALKMDRKPIN